MRYQSIDNDVGLAQFGDGFSASKLAAVSVAEDDDVAVLLSVTTL